MDSGGILAATNTFKGMVLGFFNKFVSFKIRQPGTGVILLIGLYNVWNSSLKKKTTLIQFQNLLTIMCLRC